MGAPPYHQYLVDISANLDTNWLVSVSTVLENKGNGLYELSHGIHVYDEDLDHNWIEFERARAKEAYHPDAKPYVLRIAHASTRKLIDKFKPEVILCRTAEPAPLDYFPERFKATAQFLERCGYEQKFLHQRPDRRWEWTHERAPERQP